MFLLAAVHKLTALARFRAVVAEFRVMPEILVPLVAALQPLLEVVLGLAWLFLADVRAAAFVTFALLALYTSVIAFNLLRGRVHISCGCGFGKTAGGDEPLTWGLVIRNAWLLLAALGATLPVSSRMMGVLDHVTLVAALAAAVLLFTAGNQLIRNSAAINTWRQVVKPRD
jgi:hypothetical protein